MLTACCELPLPPALQCRPMQQRYRCAVMRSSEILRLNFWVAHSQPCAYPVDRACLLHGSDCYTARCTAASTASCTASCIAVFDLFFFQLLSSDLIWPLSTSGLRFFIFSSETQFGKEQTWIVLQLCFGSCKRVQLLLSSRGKAQAWVRLPPVRLRG